MIWNYLVSTWRNLRKQKVFSLLNLFGLATGMTAFLIFSYSAISKLHADRFHKNADRIFVLVQKNINLSNEESHSSFFPARIKNALELDFPEFEDVIRVYAGGPQTLKLGERYFSEAGCMFVDPQFLRFFTFDLKSGNPQTALDDPHSIVISAQMAEKYFGKNDPIGKTMSLNNRENLVVTGVLDDLPKSTSLRLKYLLHFKIAESINPNLDNFNNNSCTVFIKTKNRSDYLNFNNRFSGFITKYWPDNEYRPGKVVLFPLIRFRFGGRHIQSILQSSHPLVVIVGFAIGIILLLVVSFNFVNLALARNFQRNKEVAIRKTLGATRSQLIAQFLGESIMLSFLALGLAIILYEFIQPFLNNYMASINPVSSARMSRSILEIPQLLYYLIGLALLTGVFSGIYPALVLSRFQPMKIFRGQLFSKPKKNRGTRVLIVFQFILSLIFIVFARASDFQFKKFLTADFGYERGNIAVLSMGAASSEESERIEQELRQNAHIQLVSAAADIPGMWSNEQLAIIPEKPDQEYTLDVFGIDYNFIEMLNIQIIQGRSFKRQHSDENHFIINESALARLKLDNPIGTQLKIDNREGVIIGIVEDFLFGDIGFEIPPAALYIEEERLNYLLFKYYDEARYNSIRNSIQEKWLSIIPGTPFKCFTLQEYWFKFFGTMNKISKLFGIVGWLAILFSALGLVGLTSYMVDRKTKEIGIRKILGASRSNIMFKMTIEFVKTIIIANLITMPLIWFAWRKILQTGILFFEPLPSYIYVLGIGISVGVASLAVYSQVLKATRVNPVVSLKYE